VSLIVTDAALGVLADLGYSPEYGARPLKRTVQKELETPLARGLVGGEYRDGDTLEVDADFDQKSLAIRVVSRPDEAAAVDETAAVDEVVAADDTAAAPVAAAADMTVASEAVAVAAADVEVETGGAAANAEGGVSDEAVGASALKSARGMAELVLDLKRQIESVKAEIEQAEQSYELSKAAELKYSVLPSLLAELQVAEEAAMR